MGAVMFFSIGRFSENCKLFLLGRHLDDTIGPGLAVQRGDHRDAHLHRVTENRGQGACGRCGSLAFTSVQNFAEQHDCTLRQAAYGIGLSRVAEATRIRGYLS